jgi:putative membrane protein
MSTKIKYGIWIKLISIIIPIVVAILFTVKIDYQLPVFLPPIYSAINGLTALLLIFALIAIKNKNIQLHSNLMRICIALSLIFLLMYITYHMTSASTIFGDIDKNGIRDEIEKSKVGYWLYLYIIILLSHIMLSIALIPMVLISYVRAIQEQFEYHKKIAKITFPIWLYVTTTGVVVYLMISPYYLQ